jgi:hypothetical protein
VPKGLHKPVHRTIIVQFTSRKAGNQSRKIAFAKGRKYRRTSIFTVEAKKARARDRLLFFSALAPAGFTGVGINDGLGKGFRSLLRQIVPYAAGDAAMLVPADVHLGIGARVSMCCAVRVAFQRNCRT